MNDPYQSHPRLPAPPFYWGVGIENCWMAEHNELNRIPRRLLDVYLQMQHYTQWKEDLDRAADLGVKAVRYNVPWYKANPHPEIYDWEWISKPLEYMVHTFPACLAYGKGNPSAPFGKVLLSSSLSEADLDWFNTNAQLSTVLGVNLYPDCYHRSSDPQEGLRLGAEELMCQLTRACLFFGRQYKIKEQFDGALQRVGTGAVESYKEIIHANPFTDVSR